MIKKLLILLCSFLVVSVGLYVYMTQQVANYVQQPLQMAKPTIVSVRAGSSFSTVLTQFEALSLSQGSGFTRFVKYLRPELAQVKAGTYQLQPELTLEQALQILVSGKEHQFSITFIEGSRFSDWRAILTEAEFVAQDIEGLSEQEIGEALNINRDNLEGLFLADTYYYTAGTTALAILKRARQGLVKSLNTQWQERKEGLPLKSPYEALILASIIEKETGLAAERPMVASVFINRLDRGMRLQTDPTVIYGMGEAYDGNIRKRDLSTPTPYNTYLISGLPPTPIAMVGRSAIVAALQPADTKYLYFVASGTGGHVFSKTLTEHNRAVRDYLKKLRNKK